jgi:transposase
MMRRESRIQPKLFYGRIDIEDRVPANHILRRIRNTIDFDFIYSEVQNKYGFNGNPSIPPTVILKMMILLVLYNVRSERELVQTLPLRLDWLWFLGYDLDTEVPNHSVLSKARKRWGADTFQSFFERIVWQCVEAGLVDGRKIFVDASFMDADASMDSLVSVGSIQHRLHKSYAEFERRLEEQPSDSRDESEHGYQKINRRRVSTTDPDSAITRDGKPKLAYQVHRAVDEAYEVITASRTTPGDVNEAHLLTTLLDDHQANGARAAETVVADSKYGTVENLLMCQDRGVRAHIPELGKAAQKRNAKRGIFGEDRFRYDRNRDVYVCPAGQELKRQGLDRANNNIVYGAGRIACSRCELRGHCTRNPNGRSLRRHQRQDDLERMRQVRRSARGRGDLRTRQHLMERSFAKSKRYGYDRARWRRLWRVQIQEYLVCAVLNIQILLKKGFRGPKAKAGRALRPSFFSALAWLRGWVDARLRTPRPTPTCCTPL